MIRFIDNTVTSRVKSFKDRMCYFTGFEIPKTLPPSILINPMAAQPMGAPMGAPMHGQPGMMGMPGVPTGGIMAPGVAPGMPMMMPGSMPAAPLPVSSVHGAVQPGMMPGMAGMPVSSAGMAMPGSQVNEAFKRLGQSKC